MAPSGYIMYYTTSMDSVALSLAIRNIVDTGGPVYGKIGDADKQELWIMPNSKKNKDELLTELKALPAIQQVFVAGLHNPITDKELLEVRAMLVNFGWDMNEVSDVSLSLFLNDRLQGGYNFLPYADTQRCHNPEKIRIVKAADYPLFSPERQSHETNEKKVFDNELTIGDLEVRSVTVTSQEYNRKPPPPPPPTKSS